MAIVFPSASVASRWNGALQARLQRAPLEAFLRSRNIAPARPVNAGDTDDVARATVLVVEEALALRRAPADGINQEQIGYLACVVSESLGQLIGQPGCWRIAALLSAATLLSPSLGLHEAALASAASVRHFQSSARPGSFGDQRIARAVYDVVILNTTCAMAAMSSVIPASFECSAPAVALASQSVPEDGEAQRRRPDTEPNDHEPARPIGRRVV